MPHPKDDMKETIINASRDIFTRFGFKKTTVDEIANSLYKTKSFIYHYFKSKEEIFQSVVEKESAVLKEEIMNAVNREKTPQNKLHTFILTKMHGFSRFSNFYHVLIDKYLTHYDFIEKLRKKHIDDEIRMISNILKNGVDEGVFSINNIDLTAEAVVTALKAFEYPLLVEKDTKKIERTLENVLNIILYGIVKR